MNKVVKRSEINKWMREFADNVNGINLSVFDVMEADGLFDNVDIIEDEKPIYKQKVRARNSPAFL